MGSQYDWNYTTEPEAGLAQRCMATPRGRVHGGSSAINAMVHTRGDRRCFDGWRALGNPGWGYDDLLPLFKRSERNDGGASEYRGGRRPSRGQPLSRSSRESSRVSSPRPRSRAFLPIPRTTSTSPDPTGVAGFYQRNILNGRRHSAAAAFLAPAMSRPNRRSPFPRSRATRLLIEGRRAVGVEYVREGSTEPMRVRAAREVVLCAGAIESPRLLMLSGIGSAEDLRAHGIDVVADLPGVGQNLQDHLKLVRSVDRDERHCRARR